jgi:hypothetical protein
MVHDFNSEHKGWRQAREPRLTTARSASPCAIDFERTETFGLTIGQRVLDDAVDARATRAAAKAGAKLIQVAGFASGNHFHIAVLSVAHPSAQIQLAGLALHKPAKADTLHTALNKEMNHHGFRPSPVLQMRVSARNRRMSAQETRSSTLLGGRGRFPLIHYRKSIGDLK